MDSYEKKLIEICKYNKNLLILTAETRFNMRNIPNIINRRFIDFGIAEQTMIGAGAGLSRRGKLPIMHALASFLTMRPFEFIRTDFGIQNLKGVFMGSFNGFMSTANGPTHQAIDDFSLMNVVPNMKIYSSSSILETKFFLDNLDKIDSPHYVRYNNTEWDDDLKRKFSFNGCEELIKGDELLIISHGNCLKYCYQAANEINNENEPKPLALLNISSIEPLNNKVFQIINNFENVLVVEDHKEYGSLFERLCKLKYSLNNNKKNIKGKNLGNKFFKPLPLNDLLDYEGFSKNRFKKLFLDNL